MEKESSKQTPGELKAHVHELKENLSELKVKFKEYTYYVNKLNETPESFTEDDEANMEILKHELSSMVKAKNNLVISSVINACRVVGIISEDKYMSEEESREYVENYLAKCLDILENQSVKFSTDSTANKEIYRFLTPFFDLTYAPYTLPMMTENPRGGDPVVCSALVDYIFMPKPHSISALLPYEVAGKIFEEVFGKETISFDVYKDGKKSNTQKATLVNIMTSGVFKVMELEKRGVIDVHKLHGACNYSHKLEKFGEGITHVLVSNPYTIKRILDHIEEESHDTEFTEGVRNLSLHKDVENMMLTSFDASQVFDVPKDNWITFFALDKELTDSLNKRFIEEHFNSLKHTLTEIHGFNL